MILKLKGMILNFMVHPEDPNGPIYVSVDISISSPGSSKLRVALLGSTFADVGRLIVRVFPSLTIYILTWSRSIRLAVSIPLHEWRL
jgi:hypothetical protein